MEPMNGYTDCPWSQHQPYCWRETKDLHGSPHMIYPAWASEQEKSEYQQRWHEYWDYREALHKEWQAWYEEEFEKRVEGFWTECMTAGLE